MQLRRHVLGTLTLVALVLASCETAPKTETERKDLGDESQTAISRMQSEDPGLKTFIDNSWGYAVFPDVGKGGLIVGGAYGKGQVWEKGRLVGYAELSQATIGAQAGGQTYSELIAFQNEEAMKTFKSNQFEFAAQASAVALKSGAASNAKYENGVVIFTLPKGGLMAEASVGGQKFTFTPLSAAK